MEQFQKGDVVCLKSGGPSMTVFNLGKYNGGMGTGPENGAACVWFEGNKKQQDVFDVDALEKVK